ncbi:MAG: NUDIX hydrolase [Bacteroidales bacterium]|nr:NUDIX hydrolase [Bacteroidales bacterium]
MYKSPKTTVGAVLYHPVKGNNTILLTKRNIEPFKNFWCLPGGHVEEFEMLESAVLREIKEETNLTFEPEYFGYFEEIFKDKNIHNVAIFYYGQAEGEIKMDEDEVSEIKWFLVNDALKMNLAFFHNKVLLSYMNLFI